MTHKAPPGYSPGCRCQSTALQPDEDCYIHGCPDPRICPYCASFMKIGGKCKRCGYTKT